MKLPDQVLAFAGREEWRAWLEAHHALDREAWVLHGKKHSTRPLLKYEEAVEEALCFGWIDGLSKGVDGEAFAQRYSPRKARSIWAESNKRRVQRLVEEGRMTPAGQAKIDEAKANGQWNAIPASEDVASIPPDLARELERNRVAAAFAAWPVSRKKQYLYWLGSAKRPETRAKRIEEIVALARGARLAPTAGPAESGQSR